MKRIVRGNALMLMVVLVLMTLAGCGTQNASDSSQAAATPASTAAATDKESAGTIELDAVQRNSIAMLNYLAVLTQEINASQNSRLYLEQAYSRLINNTYPNAVDSRTLVQLTSILDTLERYRMTAVKRERLEYVYEQNRGQSLRSAIPNPLGLVSAVGSFSLSKLATSIVYMTVDSVTSYTSANTQNELQYLQDGWTLDDEAAEALHESRKDTFVYMVRVVSDYDLPGELALNENAVDDFVFWKNNENVAARIRFFESNASTYQALGTYWLTLAESYYENGQYAECLNAVSAYEEMGCRIFRKDYDLAHVLPLAIAAAKETLAKDEYTQKAEYYISLMNDNSDYDDWSAHYFIAQTYIDLYNYTGEEHYLDNAYEELLDNVNSLVNEQKTLNTKYLTAVQKADAPKGATKAQKADIKKYNEMLEKQRETELPPVYEPLLLNCELLFSLEETMGHTDANADNVQSILHPDGAALFLTTPVDAAFGGQTVETDGEEATVRFSGEELTVPADVLTVNSTIKVSVELPDADEAVIFEDWKIEKVERGTQGKLATFAATFTSASGDKFDWKPGMKITIEIGNGDEARYSSVQYRFIATAKKKLLILNDTGFERVTE